MTGLPEPPGGWGSWETLDHTADVGLRVRAPTLGSLLATAARGLYSLCLDPSSVEARHVERIEIEAESLDLVLFEWLREILARLTAERRIYASFEFERADEHGAVALAAGEALDPKKHRYEMELKAVTMHGLFVRTSRSGYEAEVILDV